MEQQDQETEHVCKLCDGGFSSGRILGGHMRSHLGRNSANKMAKLQTCDVGGTESYGLRENPKKSWKSSGVNHDLSIDDNVKCGVCGKQFGSLRSLCGHMRHHSVKERNGVRCKECGKGFRSLRSLTGHMRLHSGKQKVNRDFVSMPLMDSDTLSLVRKKRSNRIRYKEAATDSNSSFRSFNSDFDYDQEEEEVALCLLLLSGGFGELGYSFENKSLYPNENGEEHEDVCADESAKKKPKGEILDFCASDSKNQIFECSDCDCDEAMKVELEVAVESGLKRNEFQCRICNKNFATYQALGGHQTFHRTAKSFTDERIELECLEDAIEEEEVNEAMNAWNKCKEHKCHICSRNFKSGQALGGHKRAHIAKAKEEGNCSIIKHELLVLDVSPHAKNVVLSF